MSDRRTLGGVGAPSDGGSTQLTDFVPFEIPVIATILEWCDGSHREIFACAYLHLGAPMSPTPPYREGCHTWNTALQLEQDSELSVVVCEQFPHR